MVGDRGVAKYLYHLRPLGVMVSWVLEGESGANEDCLRLFGISEQLHLPEFLVPSLPYSHPRFLLAHQL